VTNRYYSAMQQSFSLPQGTAYLNPGFSLGPSNFLWQIVFLQNADQSVSNNVYFPGVPIVEWVWPSTNIITGLAQTNHLYFEDDMITITNLSLTTNGVAPPNTGYGMTFIPTNYFFFRAGSSFFGTPRLPRVCRRA